MASFYGTVKGNRAEFGRGGTKESGLRVAAHAKDGSVIMEMSKGEKDETEVRISIADSPMADGEVVFEGSIEDLREILKRR